MRQRKSPLELRLIGMIEPIVADYACVLVDLSLGPQGRDGFVLQILAESKDTGGLDLDSCSRISRAVSAMLDVEDPIKSAYRLEVSSPGIDRPLSSFDDFIRFTANVVKVETDTPIGTQKRFKGTILKTDAENVFLETDTGVVAIPFTTIEKAKLVLTPQLIEKTRPNRKTDQEMESA